MLTLNDGRKEMYQWDIGRIATTDVECDVVHFSNLKYGESLAVEVKNGEVAIPNKLLTSGEPIYCWAFVVDENGKYTKQEQTLNVNKRAKPSDYAYTETEVLSYKYLSSQLEILEIKVDDLAENGGGVNSEEVEKIIEDYLTENPPAQGKPGKDGISATHSWNGTVLTITSASGTSSANLKGDKGDTGERGVQGIRGEKGDKGDKGDTPVRGIDYWTSADKAEIKSYVDEAILGGSW